MYWPLVLVVLLGDKPATAQTDSPWYRKHLVGMEVGPTGAQFGNSDPTDRRFAARFDGKEIVQACLKADSQYLVLWVRDGDYAYYDSKLLPKAPGLGQRDPLRDAVQEAKRHHLPIIAYCVVQQAGHFLKAHPEWEMMGHDGKPIGRFCYRSGYLDAMKQIVAEQLSFGIDGFHIDMVDQGFGPPYGCWCPTCKREFQTKFKREMPAGPTWDADWRDMLEFRYQSSQRFEQELARHIKTLRPDATVDFNYHGNPPFSFEVGQRPVQHAGNGDFVTGETGVWGFSALGVGFNAEFYRASTPGLPFQVAMQRGVRMYHDQTTRPLADIRWELLTLLAHGAFVTMVDKTTFDGALDPVAYERIGHAFREAKSKAEHFGHKPHFEVGLYYSSSTRDWIGKEKPLDWMQSILGAHKACAYEHLPFGIILDENVTIERLRDFNVVLICNAGILHEREIDLFENYVREGGRLIVTGQTGLFDSLGKPTSNPRWEQLTGAQATRRLDSLDNWLRFGPDRPPGLLGDLPVDWSFLVKGPATIYAATSAQTFGQLLTPHRTTRQIEGKEGTDWPMSAGDVVGPAILLNSVGKGRVLTFAGSPDYAIASEHHLVETRRLLAQAVRFLNPKPRIQIKAPANVQVVVSDDPKEKLLRVHLFAYISPPQSTPAINRPFVLPVPIEDDPIYRTSIELDAPVKDVKAWNPSTSMKIESAKIEATIENIHEILLIRY
jgi:hypothetical protein